jgi:hypothetical protein
LNIGPMLFYRPYFGNYVVGFLPYLWLLLPYRFAFERLWKQGKTTDRPATSKVSRRLIQVALVLGMFVVAVAAGLTNEHTGPAIMVGLLFFVAHQRYRKQPVTAWMLAGIAGIAVGFIALYQAPGQNVRYLGAGKQAVLELIASRSLLSNVTIVALVALPLLVSLIAVLATRSRISSGSTKMLIIWCGATALTMAVTLLASPKTGLRLYWAPTMLLIVATASWLLPRCSQPMFVSWINVSSAAVILIHCIAFLVVVRQRHNEWQHRFALLASAPASSSLALPEYTSHSQHWIMLDDLARPSVRNTLSKHFALADVRSQ